MRKWLLVVAVGTLVPGVVIGTVREVRKRNERLAKLARGSLDESRP